MNPGWNFRLRCIAPACAAALAVLASACSSPQKEPALVVTIEGPPNEFAAATQLLQGFDLPCEGASSWCEGQRMLLGMSVHDGDRVDSWMLRLTSVAPTNQEQARPPIQRAISLGVNDARREFTFTSPAAPIEVEVFDRDARPIATQRILAPVDFLLHGMAPACADALKRRDEGRTLEAGDLESPARGLVAFMAMLRTVQATRALAPLRERIWDRVIEQPNLLLALFVGVRIDLPSDFADAVQMESGLYRLPMPVSINDRPAIDLEIVAGAAAPPWTLDAGIREIIGRNPLDPSRRFVIRVLAARR